jgi:2-polyprenyl-6-methoxyphenol hydroxylase-like FAD-dependent oxidoreductase
MTAIVPVLIVGGGLNGLTMAALLAWHGVGCMVVERHAGTSIQYKFAGISPRSMEVFRSIGLEDAIRAARTGDQQGGEIGRGRNLADPAIEWSGAAWPDALPFSPTQPATCDQHVLEPLLRRHAESLGAEIRFNTELVELRQDEAGVHATIRDRDSGTTEEVMAAYCVAADGAHGSIRERRGIGRTGPGVLQRWVNIIFDTDLPPELAGRRFTSVFVTDINATLTPRDGGRWLLALQMAPEETPADFDAARVKTLVAQAAGREDVRAELVDARDWEAAALIADRFGEGRVFLVGDAAHLLPPTGAFGGNSGIHDAHNLAWKLALVLHGEAEPRLLETYDTERRPLIAATLDQALARLQRWFRDLGGRLPPPVAMVDDYDVVFGQTYPEGAVIGADPQALPFADRRTLSGAPGTRAPHLRVTGNGPATSTLDLFGRLPVLLTGDAGWSAAGTALAQRGYPLTVMRVGAGGLAIDGWPERLGVEAPGAVLVRPDGFVAWRRGGADAAPQQVLAEVITTLGLKAP